ncbi:MAG: TnpV protein [Eubacteriales bacterium]
MTDKRTGISYTLKGEQYYPYLALPEQTYYPIGKYGQMHLTFIKKHRRGTYTTLLSELRLKNLPVAKEKSKRWMKNEPKIFPPSTNSEYRKS